MWADKLFEQLYELDTKVGNSDKISWKKNTINPLKVYNIFPLLMGFEPTTYRLTANYSTIELYENINNTIMFLNQETNLISKL